MVINICVIYLKKLHKSNNVYTNNFFGWKIFINIQIKLNKKGQRKQYKTKQNKGKVYTANNYIQ